MTTEISFTMGELFRELRPLLGIESLALYITGLRAGDNQTTVEFIQEKIEHLPDRVKKGPFSPEEMARKVTMVEALDNNDFGLRNRYVRWTQMINFLSQSVVVGQ